MFGEAAKPSEKAYIETQRPDFSSPQRLGYYDFLTTRKLNGNMIMIGIFGLGLLSYASAWPSGTSYQKRQDASITLSKDSTCNDLKTYQEANDRVRIEADMCKSSCLFRPIPTLFDNMVLRGCFTSHAD